MPWSMCESLRYVTQETVMSYAACKSLKGRSCKMGTLPCVSCLCRSRAQIKWFRELGAPRRNVSSSKRRLLPELHVMPLITHTPRYVVYFWFILLHSSRSDSRIFEDYNEWITLRYACIFHNNQWTDLNLTFLLQFCFKL